MTQTLACKKGLVVGANEHSIAWGCAKAFQAEGAEVAVTYLNVKAEPYVRPLAQQVRASVILSLDVHDDAQMEAVLKLYGFFYEISSGKLTEVVRDIPA
jgi:enoyl-[acyl-carrier protein] reductase I